MSDFLDMLEARVPGAVAASEQRADRRRIDAAIDRALAPKPKMMPRKAVWLGLAAAALLAGSAAAAIHQTTAAHAVVTTSDLPAIDRSEPVHPPPFVRLNPTVAAADSAAPRPESIADIPVETAAELFARANQARKSGEPRDAIALYRRLESTWPRSNEASVAHVTLGRLLLDHEHDPKAALVELDAYLASGATDLREDALAMRARASGSLGRNGDEKQAWTTLLLEHPDSLYAGHAKERIEALR